MISAWPTQVHVRGSGHTAKGYRCMTVTEPEVLCSNACHRRFWERVMESLGGLYAGVSRRDLIEEHGHIVVEQAEYEMRQARMMGLMAVN